MKKIKLPKILTVFLQRLEKLSRHLRNQEQNYLKDLHESKTKNNNHIDKDKEVEIRQEIEDSVFLNNTHYKNDD